jgi:endonuclease/exonuclease/phosphatase (EEP) superfamily protein YafD
MNQPPPARSSPLTLNGLLEVATAGLILATLAGFMGRLGWLLELTSHFRLHLAVAAGVLFLVWLLRRRGRLATLCGVFTLVNAIPVWTLIWPTEQNTEAAVGPRLRLIALNVHTSNRHTDPVLNFLRQADADILLLMEVDEHWNSALEPLRATYPYSVTEPRTDNFGIALFSRLPLAQANRVELGSAEVPSIEATVTVDGRPIQLLGTHPLPPGSAEYASMRNEQLRHIAAYVQRQSRPIVVFGDLNVTPWSPYFADLLRESGLRNSSQGRGLFNSWPAWLPFGRIPLDHCLVSPTFRVVAKQLGPHVGSDHLPVTVDLQLPGPPGAGPLRAAP